MKSQVEEKRKCFYLELGFFLKETRFYEKHKDEITAFTEAHKYMTRHLNGYKSIPLDDWRHEFATINNEHASLIAESEKLSQELRSAEATKRNAEKVMGAEQQTQKRKSEIGL